jgi:DNA-binding CsgD family transcriptional regulator
MRLANYAHCMAIVPMVRGLPAGGFGVHRPAAKHDFAPSEQAILRWFVTLAARAMDYRQLAAGPRHPDRCAMIVAPAEGRVVALSDGLRAILAQLPDDALLTVPAADAPRSIWRAGGRTYAVGTSQLDANSVLNSAALADACFDPDPQLTGRKVRLPRGGRERMVVWVEPLDDAESLHGRIAEFDLSPRLRQVALLMALGRSTKAIARECRVSPNTAKEYVADVYQRLDVHTREAMLAKLARVQAVQELCPRCSTESAQPSPARRRSP